MRFPYDTALGGLGNPWTLPGNQLDTARIKNNIELVSFSQSPPPPSLQPPEFTTDLRWHRRRHLLFAAAADKRTIDPVVLHKHIVALLNAAGEVVKAPLPLPFRVWRSERVLQSDPFEKAAYLIHFDKFEDFQRALSESPSLSTAESWVSRDYYDSNYTFIVVQELLLAIV